jgi:hypothetical protein
MGWQMHVHQEMQLTANNRIHELQNAAEQRARFEQELRRPGKE